MHPSQFAWIRYFLIRIRSQKEILNPIHSEQLDIVKIPDHPMMREIFEEQRDPSCGVYTDSKIDKSLMNFGIELDCKAFWLGGDRLPTTSSTIFGDGLGDGANVEHLIPGPFPLSWLNAAINSGWWPFPSDKRGVELEVGEAFLL